MSLSECTCSLFKHIVLPNNNYIQSNHETAIIKQTGRVRVVLSLYV